MTEEEAKTKWCPQVRVTSDSHKNTISINKYIDGGVPTSCKCVASDCMMWVWDEAFDRDENGDLMGCTNYDTEGHCGLVKGE